MKILIAVVLHKAALPMNHAMCAKPSFTLANLHAIPFLGVDSVVAHAASCQNERLFCMHFNLSSNGFVCVRFVNVRTS